MLKLFHGSELIGIITDEMLDGLAMVGKIALMPEAVKYKEVFDFFADEEKSDNEEPPFSDDILYNWSIQSDSGKVEKISIPNIYPDGLICWR
ncbi:MAG: hypothetical protein JST89_22235 [Cyanobacteria bacterium SZAS-4]|nr:hypothetical protein [Cyanobacteria bacterium SZAS-4]